MCDAYSNASGTALLITPTLSFSYSSGVVRVSFWMYRDAEYDDPTRALEGVEVFVNTTAATTGATSLGFVPRASTMAPAVSADGWYNYSFDVPSSFGGTTNQIIFAGTSFNGNNIFLDDVTVEHLSDCSGTPNAGTAFATDSPVCVSAPFMLIDTGYSKNAGISFQWQSSPAGANTWTNITGATGPQFLVAAGISTATDYRVNVRCSGSALTSSSNTVSLTNGFLNCYCASEAGSSADDDIGQFTVGTYFANPASAPSTLTFNSASTEVYTDFKPLGPIQMVHAATTPFTITQINSADYYTTAISIYIDLDHNGSFSDPGEDVYHSSGYGPANPASPTFTGSFVIPATALTGVTGMRVIMDEFTTNIPPCGINSYGETEDYLVEILPATPPPPTLTSNSPVCQNDTITITAAGISPAYPSPLYTLTGAGLATAIKSTTGIFTIPRARCVNGGTFTVTVTSNASTSAPSTTNVTVNCTPTLAIGNITTPTTCLTTDGAIEITGLVPATTYTVSYRRNAAAPVTASITANAAGAATVPGLSSANYSEIWVRTPGGCSSDTILSATQVPAPNPPPTPIVAVSPTPICSGNDVALIVSNPLAGGTYAWSGPNGYTNSTSNIILSNYDPSLDGVYTVTVTVTVLGCVSAPANSTLAMTPASPRPVRNNVTYCQFDVAVPITAQTLSAHYVEWFDTCSGGPGCINGIRSRGSTPTNANAPIPNTNIPGIVMWLVRQTAPNGCPSGFDSVYARILPRPAAPTVNTLIEYCQYENVGALTAGGVNIRWFNTQAGGIGTTTAPTPSTLIPGIYYFYTSQTSIDGCESDRAEIAVVVKPKPQPPTVTSPVNLCQGDPEYQLNAVGRDLLWYTLPNGGIGVTVAPVISTAYEDSFFYYVTQTVSNCESDRALIATYIRYKPNGVITASNQSVCQDGLDTFNYYGNARADAEYVWFAPLSSQFLSGQGTPGPVVVRFDTAGTSTVQLIVNNKGCISRLLAAPITVRPLPKISFVNRQDACADDLITVALSAIEPEITAYQWDFGPEATIVYGEVRTGGPFGIRYPRAGQYAVSATATKAGCTSEPKVQDIFVHERPEASISYAYRNGRPLDQFCAGDTLNLTVRAVPEGATYEWTPLAYFQGKRDTLNSEVRAVVSMSSYVHVKVTNASGCASTDSLYVPTKPCCGVYFPNAFVPSSLSEVNRIFRPITTGIHRINNFRVMNRWGQVIWETTEARAGWDGTYRGEAQEMGTYFFYINYRCGDKNVEDRGEVILIR